MEKEQILKSLGFSDAFLKSLNEYDNIVNEIQIRDDIQTQQIRFPNFDNGNEIVIKSSNDYQGIYHIK